jgi:hypothetical protein
VEGLVRAAARDVDSGDFDASFDLGMGMHVLLIWIWRSIIWTLHLRCDVGLAFACIPIYGTSYNADLDGDDTHGLSDTEEHACDNPALSASAELSKKTVADIQALLDAAEKQVTPADFEYVLCNVMYEPRT